MSLYTTVPPEESVKYSLHEYIMQCSALSQFQQQNTGQDSDVI